MKKNQSTIGDKVETALAYVIAALIVLCYSILALPLWLTEGWRARSVRRYLNNHPLIGRDYSNNELLGVEWAFGIPVRQILSPDRSNA
ncbi:MAG: hypothetical protein V1853_02225 [bacterium]